MDTKVPFLNITDLQYKLIGITWGLIFTAIFHYYTAFEQMSYSIVKTFVSFDFAIKALVGMLVGYVFSYYVLRKINQ